MDLESIKQRKVVQWTIGYGVFALGAIGLLSSVSEPWELTLTLQRRIQMLLAMGFPLAAILSWYHGEHGSQRVDRREAGVLVVWALLTAGIVWLVPTAAGDFAAVPTAEVSSPESWEDRERIAVLPFGARGDEPAAIGLAAELAEQVRASLSSVGALRVLSGGSAAGFQPTATVADISESLRDVRYVIRASVRTLVDSVAADVEVIAASPDGSEDVLWLETLQGGRSESDLFALQRDIALGVLEHLPIQVTEDERARIARRPTSDEALLALLRQAQRLDWQINMDDNETAGGLIEAALAQDSTFAAAHAVLAGIYMRRGERSSDWALMERGRTHARTAFELAPDEPSSHVALSYTLLPYELLDEMRAISLNLLQLEPSSGFAFRNLGGVEYESGDFKQAFLHFARALDIAPDDPTAPLYIGRIWLMLEEHERAKAWFDYLWETWLPGRWAYVNQANNLLLAGDTAAARALVIELSEQFDDDAMLYVNRALMALRQDDLEDALASVVRFTDTLPDIDISRGWTGPLVRGLVYARAGRDADATRDLAVAEEQALARLERGSESWEPRLLLARVEATRGNLDTAQRWVDDAFRAGWRGVPTLLGLEPLEGRPDFERVLQRAADDRAVQLAEIERLKLGLDFPPTVAARGSLSPRNPGAP